MASVIAFINPAVSTENVGDLFIVDSLKRILSFDRSNSFDVDPRKPIDGTIIDRINREADAAIICGTNLWYRRMPKVGRWMFSLADLQRIKKPIIPFGVGTTRHFDDADNSFEPETHAQILRIHESCAVGSARDQRTVQVLEQAGVRNARMTGCPTLFRSLSPTWRVRMKESRQVVVTVRKGAAKNVRRLIRRLRQRGFDPIVAAQQDGDNFLRRRPASLLRRPTETLYEYDIRPYRELVDTAVGAIGWRLHGNMLHLAHGNPAILFSNCSRGESFCETFGLPRVPSPDHAPLPPELIEGMIDKLLDPATFAALPAHYAEHRAAMAAFLEANGLAHHLTLLEERLLQASQ